jgi:hypothetical protein
MRRLFAEMEQFTTVKGRKAIRREAKKAEEEEVKLKKAREEGEFIVEQLKKDQEARKDRQRMKKLIHRRSIQQKKQVKI